MIPARHILSQGPVLKAIGQTALRGLRQRFERGHREPPATPGPEIHVTIPARPPDLIADYVRHVGGDPDAYQDSVPPHLFPQWCFPLGARLLAGLPYPLLRVFNAGCRIEVNALLPQRQPLEVSARLESLKVDERRVLISQRFVTGTEQQPEASVAHLYAYVPLGSGKSKSGGGKTVVPEGARELQRWSLPATAGLEFALLTGDFNPLHWVPLYARAMGFKNQILHGFSTMARAFEAVQREVLHGQAGAIETFDVRFTRPLVLPASVGLFVKDHHLHVGDAPGSPAYLEGSFAARE